MITYQFGIYLCHFHCSHWLNHLLNFTFREKGPLVLVKTTFSSLFWNKLLIPHANCNGHVPSDMFHHILPQNDTLGFLGENIWVSSIGSCATLGYTAVRIKNLFYNSNETTSVKRELMTCLFVLRFYRPVNPMGSCRARSVYLTTRLLGRLSPLSG